jgi:GNAT superfamily N-acetyltransferase
MAVEITPVSSFSDVREFVDLPFRLHRGTPWVTPLKLERYAFLSPRSNPFFKHGEARLFLARRDGQVVGRISAQVDRNYNGFHETRWGFYGFIEFEDSQEVLDALLGAAEQWLRIRNCDRMIGPFDFTDNDECGVLVEGYEHRPMIRQPWHPPYYRERFEAAGMLKVVDVFDWDLALSDRDGRMNPTLPRLAQRAHDRYGVEIRKMSFWHLGRDLKQFAKVYNAAWSKNWGYQPLDEHDIADMAVEYRLLFDKPWFMLAENEDGVIGAAMTIPDMNQVLAKMGGRILPFGWLYYLRRKQIVDHCRVGFLGVLPEYQHTGAGAALYVENFNVASVSRIKRGEPGWILETNHSMNRGLEEMGGRVIRRMRIYERLLDRSALPAAPPVSLPRYEPQPAA